MDRIPVSSSNIRSIGYDEANQILEVEFHHGLVYHYHNVPVTIYQALMSAPSKGQFLNQHVKSVYRYSRLAVR